MHVSFLKVEAAGNGAVADALGEQSEGQQDSVGQGQASPSGHSSPAFGALEQGCDTLGGRMEIKNKRRENCVTGVSITQSGGSTGISGELIVIFSTEK